MKPFSAHAILPVGTMILSLLTLSGCLPGRADGPDLGPAGLEAMRQGEPCYFRGEVDFCKQPVAPEPPPPPKDSDGDGVLDDLDQCPGTPKGAWVNEVGCWVLEDLPFRFDQHILEPASYPLLERVARVLRDNPGVRVEIQGHTDGIGTPEYNEDLSKKRAASVMRHLTGQGIAPERLSAAGFGMRKPVASNEDETGRAKNRRVELKPMP
ncbi:MAG: OmpA family protein [Magnetococcales bacterium]|nr:OmpA family protein [Magnetococcales bacterium]